MLEEAVAVITLLFTLPVLASSYYSTILLLSSFRYPRSGQNKREPSKFPVVSILIATYNEKFVIPKTLDAIATMSYPKEKLQVIVADDSNDETTEIIDQKTQHLRDSGIDSTISRREKRLGFKSGALNEAARLVKGEYVLLLDADSIVTPEVLTRGLATFEENPGLGFVSFRVVDQLAFLVPRRIHPHIRRGSQKCRVLVGRQYCRRCRPILQDIHRGEERDVP